MANINYVRKLFSYIKKEHGLSQREIAALCGRKQGDIHKWIKKRHIPDANLNALSDYYLQMGLTAYNLNKRLKPRKDGRCMCCGK